MYIRNIKKNREKYYIVNIEKKNTFISFGILKENNSNMLYCFPGISTLYVLKQGGKRLTLYRHRSIHKYYNTTIKKKRMEKKMRTKKFALSPVCIEHYKS